MVKDLQGLVRVRVKRSEPYVFLAIRIATRVAAVLRGDPFSIAVLSSIPETSTETALIIITHELIWDLIDMLVADGVVELPRALHGKPVLSPELLRPLVYAVRKGGTPTPR